MIAGSVPLRLTTDQMEDPGATLQNLFTNWTLDEMRAVFWDVFSRTLAADDDQLDDFSRDELLYYYEQAIEVFEAACMLFKPDRKPLNR